MESVSENEEATGPYQRAMTLRKRTQNSDNLSDVMMGSSAEELDVFDDESQGLIQKPTCSVTNVPKTVHNESVAATKTDDVKKTHRFGTIRRILGKGRADHDSEKRKSIAARKSISKARRIRRKSGTTGSQSSQSQPETEITVKTTHAAPLPRRYEETKTTRDQKEAKAPPERALTAKELIAAAEARSNQMGIGKADSLKRKADAIADDSKARSVRRKSIKRNYRTNRSFLFRRQVNVAATKRRLGLI